MKRVLKANAFGAILATATIAGHAWAQGAASQVIYKHVDGNGRVTYANAPIKGGVKVELEPLTILPSAPVAPTQAAAKTATAKLASLDTILPKRRDEIDPRLLQEQIDTEAKLLKDARAQLDIEQEGAETVRALRAMHAGDDGKNKDKPPMPPEVKQHIDQYYERVRNLQDEIAKRGNSLERLRVQQARISQ